MESIPQSRINAGNLSSSYNESLVVFQFSNNRSTHRKSRKLLEQIQNKVKKIKALLPHQLPTYLDELMWFEQYGQTSRDAFLNVFVMTLH